MLLLFLNKIKRLEAGTDQFSSAEAETKEVLRDKSPTTSARQTWHTHRLRNRLTLQKEKVMLPRNMPLLISGHFSTCGGEMDWFCDASNCFGKLHRKKPENAKSNKDFITSTQTMVQNSFKMFCDLGIVGEWVEILEQIGCKAIVMQL